MRLEILLTANASELEEAAQRNEDLGIPMPEEEYSMGELHIPAEDIWYAYTLNMPTAPVQPVWRVSTFKGTAVDAFRICGMESINKIKDAIAARESFNELKQ